MAFNIISLLCLSLTLISGGSVELKDDYVRIGDVAELSQSFNGNESEILGLILIKSRPEQKHFKLTNAQIENLILRRVPSVTLINSGSPTDIQFTKLITVKPIINSPKCYEASHFLESGALLSHENTAETPCAGRPKSQMVSYERNSQNIRLNSDVRPGSYFGRLPNLPENILFDHNDTVIVSRTFGTVTVSRSLQALEPYTGNGAVFLKDESGQIVSVDETLLLTEGKQ